MADCLVWGPATAVACALGWQCSFQDNGAEDDDGALAIRSPFQKPLAARKEDQYREWEPSFYREPAGGNRPVTPRPEAAPLLAHHVRAVLMLDRHR